MIPAYTDAVCREIELLSTETREGLPLETIYFGGGTPSLLSIDNIEKILSTIDESFHISPSPEISLEANPGTISDTYLKQLHSLGVNRLSLGMQTANHDELTLLERQHTIEDVINAVEWSRDAGFTNLNLDLIFGLPYQGLNSWVTNLETALSLHPEHLSLYALSLEHGTPMYHIVKAGFLPEQDQDLAAEMYEEASIRLANAGYIQYEISNWARNDKNGANYACKHNLQYWRSLPYLGVGAGAHGFINHQRTVNIKTPGAYIKRISKFSGASKKSYLFPRTPATIQIHSIDNDTEIGETMIMGLRLVLEGISDQEFQGRFGISLRQRFSSQIDRLTRFGLLEWAGEEKDILRLTSHGRLLGNQVFLEFI